MADRLSGLDNQRISGNVQPYSSFVRWIKIILPLSVLGIVGLLILWPQIMKVETAPLTREDITALKEAERENRLLQPVYNTLDSKGNPVLITAQEARQNRDEKNKVYLINPSAEMTETDNILSFHASEGEYDQTRELLILNKGVTLKDQKNNILTTESLTTSIIGGTAESNAPAKLTTEHGTIEGESVKIDYEKQTTIFQGPAKAVINQ
jgi:lipopolysaccharide export system protein LptC